MGLHKPATAAKRLLGLRALGRRGWAVEPELEVELARSPFELWVLLTEKPCRTAELQPDPLMGLASAKSGAWPWSLVVNPCLICAAYRGKLNRLFQDECG